jgi:hypothetical protein
MVVEISSAWVTWVMRAPRPPPPISAATLAMESTQLVGDDVRLLVGAPIHDRHHGLPETSDVRREPRPHDTAPSAVATVEADQPDSAPSRLSYPTGELAVARMWSMTSLNSSVGEKST